MSDIQLYNGDCLDILPTIGDGTVDAIITDLPYGTTNCKWDIIIPFEKLWEQFKRIRKPKCPSVLFGQEPFSSLLRMSNLGEYKYDWIWEKERFSNVLCVKHVPGKVHELISVFYKESPTYNPQMEARTGKEVKPNKIKDGKVGSVICSSGLKPKTYIDNGFRYPKSIIRINRDILKGSFHPTQKPVELLEYLVKTYTNEGDVVLDATMGSGSTGIACKNLNRNFIGIEKDPKYFEVAKKRIEEANG